MKDRILTCAEWKSALFTEDAEITGGAVPRTEVGLMKLWEMYKSHHSVYKVMPRRYCEYQEGLTCTN